MRYEAPMRACLLTLIFLCACGPGSPLVGTWRYDLDMKVQTPAGEMVKRVTFDLDLGSSAAADLVVWKIGGGCNVALGVAGKIATLSPSPPLCGLSPGAKLSIFEAAGAATVKADDQLAVKEARFEVLDDGKLSTRFDVKLHTDLKDARTGPQVTLTTSATTHGTRVR